MSAHFAEWDRDQDGTLSTAEIELASCAPFREKAITEEAKQKLLEEILRQISTTQAAGRLICGGTASGKTAHGHRPPGLHGPHACAVLHYDPKSDVATLWDPHGDDFTPPAELAGVLNGYPHTQGRLRLPLPELVQWFGGFSFETTWPIKD